MNKRWYLSFTHFWADVVGRAEDGLGAPLPGGEHLGDTKVTNLDCSLLGEEDVGRLEVPVEHIAGVHVAECRDHLGEHAQDVTLVNPTGTKNNRNLQVNLQANRHGLTLLTLFA